MKLSIIVRRALASSVLLVAACGGDTQPPTVTLLPDGPGADAGGGLTDAPPGVAQRSFVFVETNDPRGNAILEFVRAGDGSIAFDHGVYETGGVGLSAGADQRRGPLDANRQLALSADAHVLYAVNEGGNSIAAFAIARDGALGALTGSPYRTAARNPSSLAVLEHQLYVVDKAVDGTTLPAIDSMMIDDKGALVPESAVRGVPLPMGASPATAMFGPSARFLASTMYYDAARPKQLPAGQLAIFLRDDVGALVRAPGSPIPLPSDPGADPNGPAVKLPVALGVASHPSQPILYVGFPTRGQLGVYTYDPTTGTPTFADVVTSQTTPGLAWPMVDRDGHCLYALAQDAASVITYDLTNPLAPTIIHMLPLAHGGIDSRPAQMAFDVEQHHLYVVSQRVATDPAIAAGNYLHELVVAPDGTLSEPFAPIDLRDAGVYPDARPQGVVVAEPLAIR